MSKKQNKSISQQLQELKDLLARLENDEVEIDELAALLKRAKEIKNDCETRLAGLEAIVNGTSEQDISDEN